VAFLVAVEVAVGRLFAEKSYGYLSAGYNTILWMSEEPDFIIDNDNKTPTINSPGTPDTSHVHAAHAQHAEIVDTSRKEYMKLFGILLFLALAGLLTSTLNGFNWEEWMRWFMGGFFIVFGSFKLISFEMFVIAFRGYDIIAKRHKVYAYFYPFLELFLGMLYIANLLAIPRDIITFAIMSISGYGIAKSLGRKERIQCACLGTVIRLPLTTVSLIENITMAAMALMILLTTLFT
jgi:hypothetical protein